MLNPWNVHKGCYGLLVCQGQVVQLVSPEHAEAEAADQVLKKDRLQFERYELIESVPRLQEYGFR